MLADRRGNFFAFIPLSSSSIQAKRPSRRSNLVRDQCHLRARAQTRQEVGGLGGSLLTIRVTQVPRGMPSSTSLKPLTTLTLKAEITWRIGKTLSRCTQMYSTKHERPVPFYNKSATPKRRGLLVFILPNSSNTETKRRSRRSNLAQVRHHHRKSSRGQVRIRSTPGLAT